MNVQLNGEIDSFFVPAPLSPGRLTAILEGMASQEDTNPAGEDFPTNAAVTRLWTGDQEGTPADPSLTPGYVIAYGRIKPGLQPLRVEEVTGTDVQEREMDARMRIGRGGEFIGMASFGEQGNEKNLVIYRRAVETSGPQPAVGDLGKIFSSPGHQFLDRLQAVSSATDHSIHLLGLAPGGLRIFRNAGAINAILLVTDADIDSDGPGGSHAKDPCWQGDTSLHDSHGVPCDSRIFPGVVVPPVLTSELGVRIGDFAVAFYQDKIMPCQVYDSGPRTKIGEISVALAWALGIPPVPTDMNDRDARAFAEVRAARRGNDVRNLVTVIFPGSGNGKAVDLKLIAETSNARLKELTAQTSSSKGI